MPGPVLYDRIVPTATSPVQYAPNQPVWHGSVILGFMCNFFLIVHSEGGKFLPSSHSLFSSLKGLSVGGLAGPRGPLWSFGDDYRCFLWPPFCTLPLSPSLPSTPLSLFLYGSPSLLLSFLCWFSHGTV